MQKPSIPQGMRDFAPEVMLRRDWIFSIIRAVFRKYGYLPLETPTMENLSVLTGKYGEEGDRLIFKVLNNGLHEAKEEKKQQVRADFEEILHFPKSKATITERALRYDLTVPFARFVVMNHGQLVYPFKRFQIQPVWRADRPQKGRYREFYQCDADVVGSDALLFEAEFVCIYDEALSEMGLTDFTIQVNNRKILSGFAEVIGQSDKFVEICTAIDKMDKIGEVGVRKELLESGIAVNDCNLLFEIITFQGTNEEKIAFLEEAFENSTEGKKGVEEMKEVFALLANFSLRKAKVEFSLLLARGLNYYTGTIYEVKVGNVQIGSIGGGGRYDNLTGIFGLPGISGVGISFGADRIYDVLNELNLFPQNAFAGVKVLIVNFGNDTLSVCLKTLQSLRDRGIAAEMYPKNTKIKNQFEYANKKNIPYTLVIGTEEAEKGVCKLKNMDSGEQQELQVDEVLTLLMANN